MGRRGNRNKKTGKARTKIARKKFRRTFCTKCGLCASNSGIRFCYNKIYLQDPEKFANIVHPKLIKNHILLAKLIKDDRYPILEDLRIFKSVFCDSDLCAYCKGEEYKSSKTCYDAFIKQATQKRPAKQTHKVRKPEPAVMTALISNNDDFEKEVIRILDEYNKNKKSERCMLEDRYKKSDQNSTPGQHTKGNTG